MSLEEFKSYLRIGGVDYDDYCRSKTKDKVRWREAFDKWYYKQNKKRNADNSSSSSIPAERKVMKLMESSPTCSTISGFGKQLRKNYQNQVVPVNAEDEHYINPYCNTAYRDEKAFNADIYNLFKECTSPLESDGMILVNGEDHLSLVDKNFESNRKPDFILFHRSFYVEKDVPSGGRCNYYGTIQKEFQNQLLCFFEGKISDINADTNVGVLLIYESIMLNLGIQNPIGVLYNQSSMILCDGIEAKLYRSEWNHSAINFIRSKILNISFPSLTSILIQLCKFFEVEAVIGGYSGSGANGICFKVESIVVKDNQRTTKVVKIILDKAYHSFKSYCHTEYINAID